jgi:hypothetical protein
MSDLMVNGVVIEPIDCDSYRALAATVEKEARRDSFHDYFGKLAWVVERARHYAAVTGLSAEQVLDCWEKNRRYWYMNYYGEWNQPRLDRKSVRTFESRDSFSAAIGSTGFRCPNCRGVSKDPYACTCDNCDWKAYGLFGTMGEGVTIVITTPFIVSHIFTPIAFETSEAKS